MGSSEQSQRRSRALEPTVDQARAFCAVAAASSYKEAAERMQLGEYVSLIRLVGRFTRALEQGPLVEHEAKGRIRLTPAGRRALSVAQRFVEAADDLKKLEPEIRFSAYPTIAGRLAARCPQLLEQQVPLVLKNISEANRQDGGWKLVHDVASGRLDMAIAPAHLREERVIERVLYSWRLRVIFPRRRAGDATRRLREQDEVTPADIAAYRIAAAPLGHKSRELLEDAFAMANVDLRVALESPNQELLRAVARGGRQHVAVIPDDAFDSVDVKKAPVLHVEGWDEPLGGEYALYTRKDLTEKEDPEGSQHEAAVVAAAEELADAFGEDDPDD